MNGENNIIINIASTAGINGIGSNIIYSASKAAVINMTKSFSRILGPKIRVNAIAPGLTESKLTDKAPLEYIKYQKNLGPIKRLCYPFDISTLAIYLSDHLTYINGETIILDGGKV